MRAVNLIPTEERRARRTPFSDVSGPTRGLVGFLVLAILAVAVFVTLSNGVSDRRARLASVQAQAAVVEQQAAALKPYGDVAALRERSLQTVRSLAAERFDWPGMLGEVSRRLPADVTLMSLNGTAPEPVAASAGAAPTPGASGARVQLSGCTSDHSAVARVMERLRAVSGVADVQLASSNATGASSDAGNSGGCPRRDQFQMVLALAAPEQPAAAVAPPQGATE